MARTKRIERSTFSTSHKPEAFRGPLASLKLDKPTPPPWQTPPLWFTGSGAEWAIYWALLALKISFQYQANMLGGRKVLGGAVVDFVVPDRHLLIRVQGVHWHYGLGRETQENDQLQKSALKGQGYLVVDIDEDNALADPKYYVQAALEGRDLSRAARGV